MPNVLYRNHMGNDLEVVNDARISFAATTSAHSWELTEIPNPCSTADKTSVYIPRLNKADQNLISFLARGCRSGDWDNLLNKVIMDSRLTRKDAQALLSFVKRMPTHWTPFGQQVIKLRMKAPIPIRTQCFKHKIGFVENEESRRYIKSTPELFIPEFRMAPESDIKQGSGGSHPENDFWKVAYQTHCLNAVGLYEQMIADGVAPEQARFILPQGVYVNWVWTGSLYAYAEFYNKRNDPHAQGEIQDLAHEIGTIISALYPVSWKALTE